MRSAAMRAVRSRKNRSTEIPVKMALVRAGLSGWKMHQRCVIGCPDFLFQAKRVALFVDGCFWHGCSKCCHLPRTNTRYWATKITLNKRRDRRTTRALQARGYQVLRVWEHEIRSNVDRCLDKIIRELRNVDSVEKVARRRHSE
jgi:DNA mismatch endonuclease (patch repair protein)